jgi:TatD DNase family protein
MMKEQRADTAGGVMHCFTEEWSVAKRALDLGFYISMSGIVSFKNATVVHEVAKKIPLDRLLIETDSPYLAPTPHRGKLNEPAFVSHVAAAVAALRGVSVEEIGRSTTNNFFNLFNKIKRIPHAAH